MVSEDELPTESSKEPLETEAVSDEELPDPTAAVDLPETEAVSEDELPPEKMDKKKKKAAAKQPNVSGKYESKLAGTEVWSIDILRQSSKHVVTAGSHNLIDLDMLLLHLCTTHSFFLNLRGCKLPECNFIGNNWRSHCSSSHDELSIFSGDARTVGMFMHLLFRNNL